MAVGVIKGTTNQELAEDIQGVGPIVNFQDMPTMFDALIAGLLEKI